VSEVPYLSNVIAQHDINDLSVEEINESNSPHLIFSIEQLSGDHPCVAVQADALSYAAESRIDDTSLFADALQEYARHGEEVFFEMDYLDFIDAYPFQEAGDIRRLGILIVPSINGYRFQTLTLLDDGSLMHDPYYMFLPVEAIDTARAYETSEDFSHALYQGMEVEFPGSSPDPDSPLGKQITEAVPVSATLATIGVSLLALKGESESTSEEPLPILQSAHNAPTILSLTIS
jgi:hypothetical protein